MASPRAQPADELVAISDECDKRIVDVLDWALIEDVELCMACYANPTRQPAKKAK